MIGDGDDDRFGVEGRADVAILPVGRKDLHARATRHDDAGLLLVGGTVENSHIVLATHGDPDLFAVRAEERLVRRAPDIRRMLHRIGGGIDEGDRIGTDRNHGDGPMVG